MNNKKNPKVSSKKDSKIINLKSQNTIYIKKLKLIFIVVILIFVLLLGRLGFLQFIESTYLKELAYNQQSINQIISPKRGDIYD